jgi:hypothetical protein
MAKWNVIRVLDAIMQPPSKIRSGGPTYGLGFPTTVLPRISGQVSIRRYPYIHITRKIAAYDAAIRRIFQAMLCNIRAECLLAQIPTD